MEEEDLASAWSDAALDNNNSSSIDQLIPSLAPSSSLSFFSEDIYEVSYDDDEHISSLSETQDKVLSVLPLLSGLLSAYGSANIIWMVYQSKPSTRNCYKRLLFGLSCSDFVSSIILGFQPFLLPADTSHRIWAIGTDTTCSMMGFFQQLSLSNIWYNGMLSFYFLLTIRYGIQMATTVGWRETIMHVLSVGIPLTTAFIGLVMGFYGELRVGHFCYFTGPPLATHIAFGVGGLPAFLCFFAIPINNVLVYCHVRKQQKGRPSRSDSNSQRRRRRGRWWCWMWWKNKTATRTRTKAPNYDSSKKLRYVDVSPPEQAMHNNNNNNDEPPMIFLSGRTAMTSATTTGSADTTSTTRDHQLEEQRELRLEQQRQELQHAREQKRIQQVAFQAFLYVAAYFVSYLPTAILRVIAALNSMNASYEAQLFPLLVAQAILWPLQGLFNYIIYCRSPSYLRESIVVDTDEDDVNDEDINDHNGKEEDDDDDEQLEQGGYKVEGT